MRLNSGTLETTHSQVKIQTHRHTKYRHTNKIYTKCRHTNTR